MKRSIAFSLFFISFGIYLKTLCPTITFADSGELITASYFLGIPHPPGSPLYCFLGKLFTFLPFGSIAYRVNLMSAFFASLTVVFVYLIILKIQVNRSTGQLANWQTGKPFTSHIPAIVAAFCFAFSKSFWSYALVAEIYTLKAFFLALLIFILLKWREALLTPNSEPRQPEAGPPQAETPNSTHYLYLFALIYGLSFSNHITMMIFFPAFLFFLLITDWRSVFNLKNVILVLLLFSIGLSCYLYLPLRSLHNPFLDWGNPENLKNFIWVVTGKQYHYRLFSLPLKQFSQQLKGYFINFGREFTWLPILLGIFGLGCLFKRWRLSLFFLLIFLSNSVFNLAQLTFQAPTHFIIPSFLIFSLWIGYGLLLLSRYIRRKAGNYLLPLFLLLLLAPFQTHYSNVDQSKNYSAYDWARNVLELVEEKGIIIDKPIFPFWYSHYVEGQRPKVTTISPSMFSHPFPWYLEKVQRERPELDIIPQPGKTKNYLRYFDYVYPVNLEAINKLLKEYKDNPEMRFAWLVNTIITNYIIDHNIKRHPIYITSTNPDIAENYYLISRGPIYEIRKDKPQLIVKDPRIQYKAPIRFSDDLYFLGYDLSSQTIKPGERLHLTYYWRMLKKPLKGKIKVLLIFADEEGRFETKEGLPKFHECHLLAYGLPLNYESNQVIKEDYFSIIPSDLSSGTYYLYLITQDLEEEKLLKVEETHMPQSEGFVRIGKLEVLKR
ncbi:DUF2723 domain-containing protein [bacterium]|nr:DUF2723 domain-containing protein [bacterium]